MKLGTFFSLTINLLLITMAYGLQNQYIDKKYRKES